MKCCTVCRSSENSFRIRKDRTGGTYEVAVCIICERKQKREAERSRYASFNEEQRAEHNRRGREQRQKESYREWHREWQKRRELEDVSFRLKRRVSALIRNSLHKQGARFQEVLGYSPNDLRCHLEALFEPWMTWSNWGTYTVAWDDGDISTWTWQIDHIVPVDSFQYKDFNDAAFKQCWSLDNLRPLSAKENLLKGSKR